MWKKNLTNLDAQGIFRSLNGAADENIFIGKASKAGFFCFFKVWRDMPYDAVLDYGNVLYRIEVKGSSGKSFSLTRGGRSGAQINRDAEDRTRRINRDDCDFIVCVDSNAGDCYILPVDVLEIYKRESLSLTALKPFKEKWNLFIYDEENGLTPSQVRDGLLYLDNDSLQTILQRLNVTVPEGGIKVKGAQNLVISDEKEKMILSIWLKLCSNE